MTRSAPLTNHLGAQALLGERYRDVPAPLSESLDQCSERLRPFLRGELAEAMRKVVDECRVVAEQVGGAWVPISAAVVVGSLLVTARPMFRRVDDAMARSLAASHVSRH